MLPRVLEPEVMDTADEAEAYDAMDHAEGNAAFVERVVELAGGDPGGWFLDLGTGPGEIPLMLCERAPRVRVIGIDLSWQMLQIAERRRHASPCAERVVFQYTDVKALPFVDGVFDGVISNTILHHIPEPTTMLREAARVLRPGGVLLIRDLFRPDTPQRLQELVERHAGDCTAEQQRLFAASLHAALTPEELKDAAAASGMQDAEIVIDSDRHVSLQLFAQG